MEDQTRQRVMRKIENCIHRYLEQLNSEKELSLQSPSVLGGVRTVMKGGPEAGGHFDYVMVTLNEIYQLLCQNSYCTKRDLYYQVKRVYKKQTVTDRAITTICDILQESRINLHIYSTPEGFIVGDIQWERIQSDENGFEWIEKVNCPSEPILIPNEGDPLHNLKSEAQFILVVEKDATLQKLLDEKFLQKYQCVLITGKGYPDINTRRVIRILVERLHLPVFALVDADPHGVEIYCTYKYGPREPTFENRGFEIPEMKCLGVFPSEIQNFLLSPHHMLPLSDLEYRKVAKLLHRKEIENDPSIAIELENMMHSHHKVEIEALSELSPNYLTNEYIPRKLSSFNTMEHDDNDDIPM